MDFYRTDVYDREVDYTQITASLPLRSSSALRSTNRPRAHGKVALIIGTAAMASHLSLMVPRPPLAVSGTSTVAVVRNLSAVSGSRVPVNPLPALWRKKADRFAHLFTSEERDTAVEREFDVDHDI